MAKALKDDHRTDSNLLKAEAELLADQKFKKACRAISNLKFDYQTVLSLRYFEGKSVREIAEILGCPISTAQARVRLAYQHLRVALASGDLAETSSLEEEGT